MFKKTYAMLVVFVMALAAASPSVLAANVRPPQRTFTHGLIILNDGSLWGWAPEMYDDGRYADNLIRTHVMDNVIGVSTHGGFVIKAGGSLWGRGDNQAGNVGDGTQIWRDEFVHVLDNVVSVSASGHTMAITADGGLYTWGGNNHGELGDGTRTHDVWARGGPPDEAALHNDWLRSIQISPRRLMDNVVSIAAGTHHSMAVTADGGLYTWGSNEQGQLGGGTVEVVEIFRYPRELRTSPERIMNDVAAVYAFHNTSLAIKTDGSLWAWGLIHRDLRPGERGMIDNQHYPIHIMDDVVHVSLSAGATMVIRSDGSLWAWGGNRNGILGDGTTTNRDTPVHIKDNVVDVSISGSAMALTADGTLWTWGHNNRDHLLGGPTERVGGFIVGDYSYIRTTPYPVMQNVMLPGSAIITPAAAAPSMPDTAPTAQTTDITVLVNNTEMTFANPPLVRHGFTFFQIDEIFEALADSTRWNSETRTVTGTLGDNVIEIPIDEHLYIVNGASLDHPLEFAPFVEAGLIYVYIDFIVEGFGLSLSWDSETRTISITN